MTTIVIFKSKNTYRGFTCIGHAGYGRPGKDIVCASISILVINTINAIEELAGEIVRIDQNEEEGFIECHFPNLINAQSKLLMDAMVMGLKNIEKNYGKRKKKTIFELIIKEV